MDTDYYQDCRTLRIAVEVPPEALATTQDILWQQLGSIPQAEPRFHAAKKELRDEMYRMDYAGHDLLDAAMLDLEGYHRLISFTEELHQVEQTTFAQVRALAAYLTPERHFCFIEQP